MRLHLVDGTFELFRAHYSKRPSHTGPRGDDLKATLGVVHSMLTLLQDTSEQVTHLAVAFDNPIVSFRNDLFAGYKSDEGMEPALRAQFDLVEDAVRSLGITVWSMNEFEADDALATGAARWRDQVDQVRILTPDKDLGQCLVGERVVQVDVIRKKVIDEAALLERRGIKPESIPDWLALTGDDADGIPGLQGFGEKSATGVLAKFVHLEHIPPDAKDWPAGIRGADKLAATLRESRDAARLYRTLATLRTDVPLAESLEDLRYKGTAEVDFDELCRALGAKDDLRQRVPKWT
ncbi:MAG: flap endonuclease [Deltaproteobacteria bacterium]|nr:flap endonuclease [Deltaproteobacteria bacterium]